MDAKAKGAWLTIRANRDEMLRLFQNLIGNALKHRAAGPRPAIAITIKPGG